MQRRGKSRGKLRTWVANYELGWITWGTVACCTLNAITRVIGKHIDSPSTPLAGVRFVYYVCEFRTYMQQELQKDISQQITEQLRDSGFAIPVHTAPGHTPPLNLPRPKHLDS